MAVQCSASLTALHRAAAPGDATRPTPATRCSATDTEAMTDESLDELGALGTTAPEMMWITDRGNVTLHNVGCIPVPRYDVKPNEATEIAPPVLPTGQGGHHPQQRAQQPAASNISLFGATAAWLQPPVPAPAPFLPAGGAVPA